MNAHRPGHAGGHADQPAPARPAFAGRTRSPCISVCRIDPADGLCEGCLRTLDEIASWGTMRPEQRLAVWALLDERRAARKPPATAPGQAGAGDRALP